MLPARRKKSNGNGSERHQHAIQKSVRERACDNRQTESQMLLQAACVISAGFSHTALRQPCMNAACQRPELRIYATAAADDNDARIRLKSHTTFNKTSSESR